MTGRIIIALFLLLSLKAYPQQNDSIFDLNEFLGFVKKNHPVAAQANLKINTAQANLLKARGGFDPKIAVDYDRKDFKDTEYYDLLYGTFKIPTWFGIELQAGYELNDGNFLNPQNVVPEDGLYSAGISVPIGQGLFINERMATLKQAKIFTELNAAERELQINQLLYESIVAYMDWFRAYREYELYSEFLENADYRLRNLKRQIEEGDKAPIDSIELGITVQNRRINLRNAELSLLRSRLALSNFLWDEAYIPLEIAQSIRPAPNTLETLSAIIARNGAEITNFDVAAHPKIRAMRSKIETLEVDRRLKAEMLKPELNLNYNFITSDAEQVNTINTGDYKFGLEFSFPIFLRKERGALQMSKFKIQDANYAFEQESLTLKNKVIASLAKVDNYVQQRDQVNRVTTDYEALLQAEERKFSFGESSVFLLNSRERSLLQARLKQIELNYKLAEAQAELIRTIVLDP
ncbi:TolC family protein [Robertkochia sediminum]|uniref:TolC family protein n=1 Tax=Robertkochia sediminum TaxID=2785326 RepID=UPI001932DBBC|nr:TolC family protein [Robertkochia sediminum]MBL7471696.1 TolC family protein [Robertkochia sediminum]